MIDDDRLLTILRAEETDSASYYASELATKQAEAMARYNGDPYGDEVVGRSRVVTRDVADTINWLMPHLMRTFAHTDELVTCDDPALDDGDASLEDAAAYLNHVFWRDNRGEIALHDFCFDGLLQKCGVMRVAWADPEPKPPRLLEGVTADQVVRYQQDPEYKILEHESSVTIIDGQQVEQYTLKVQHKPRVGRAVVEAIPPEEFRLSRRAASIDEAGYHCWKHQVYLADVLRLHPEAAARLDPEGALAEDDSAEVASDARLVNRFPDEISVSTREADYDPARRKGWQCIEYLRIDYDGDGIVELRRIKRIGDVILENDAVDESEFVLWSPIRVAHRAIGESVADTLTTLQKIRTVLTRAALDSLSRSLLTTTIVDKRALLEDGSTLDRLLDHDIGGVITVNGLPDQVVRERVIPDVSQNALTAIEYFDRRAEEASGVNRHAQGIAPEAITQTKGGIELLQAAANSRVEQIARWLSHGLQDVFQRLLRLLIDHQDQPRIIKINGRRLAIDPRRWSDEMTVAIHVGIAADSRDKRLVNLNLIAQKQEAILLNAGPDNPLVTLQHYRKTLSAMVEAMGYRDASRFFGDVPDGYQPPPKADPKAQESQAKLQLAQAEQQGKQQIAEAELQGRMQMQQAEMAGRQQVAHAELMSKHQIAEASATIAAQQAAAKAQTERDIAALKAESERQIALLRIESEQRIAQDRLAAEMDLARWTKELEARTAIELGKKAPNGSDESGAGGGFRPGGRLDA